MTLDGSGNIYVADKDNHTIRKITQGGVVSTIGGLAGYPGTADGAGSNSRFTNPTGVALDNDGNVYVADAGNNTIRKITPEGMVSTVAGLAGIAGSNDGIGTAARFSAPAGIKIATNGNLYVAECGGNNTIRLGEPGGSFPFLPTSIATQPASHAVQAGQQLTLGVVAAGTPAFTYQWLKNGLVIPGAMGHTYTASNMLPGDAGSYKVVVTGGGGAVTSDSAVISVTLGAPYLTTQPSNVTIGTGGTATLSASAVGQAPMSYQWFRGASGNTSNPAAGGTNASFTTPALTETADYWVRVTNTAGFADSNTATVVVDVAPRITAQPTSVALNATGGTVIFTSGSSEASATYQWLKNGIPIAGATASTLALTNVGGRDAGLYSLVATNLSGSATSAAASLTFPADVSYTFSTLAGLAGSSGSADGTGSAARFDGPGDVEVDSLGNIYVSDTNNKTVRKITSGGVVSTLAGQPGSAGSSDGAGSSARFSRPTGIAVDGAGNLYVADSGSHTIRKITPGGVVGTLAGLAGVSGSADGTGSSARFNIPGGVAVDGSGNLFITDSGNNTIRKITPGNLVSTVAGLASPYGDHRDGLGSAARFSSPHGVAVDSASNAYVSDWSSYTIRKIMPEGVVSTLAGLDYVQGTTDGAEALFYHPAGVALDSERNVYVADSGNCTIRKITHSGVTITIGGLDQWHAGSTDGIGSVARFNNPTGMAVDNAANIYVADYSNNTIRVGVPTRLFSFSPTVITVQPMSQGLLVGQPLTLSVVAAGTPSFTYQWLRNGIVIPQATGSTFTISNTLTEDGGNYCVVVTGGGGAATSNTAVVSTGTLTIATQPANVTISAGGTTTLSVNASGADSLSYQWYQGDSGNTTSPISGATSSTFATPLLVGTSSFWVRVSNAYGSLNSQTATVNVIPLTFPVWLSSNNLTGLDAAATADPDGDGIPNLVEYGLGLNPKSPGRTGLPGLAREGGDLIFRFTVPIYVSGISYTVQASTDLGDWQDTIATTVESTTATTRTITATVPPGAPEIFVRLLVTQP